MLRQYNLTIPVPNDLARGVVERIRAFAAATDNTGLFFGEDIFIAFGAVLLIYGFYEQNGIVLDPRHIALWAAPTAIAASAASVSTLVAQIFAMDPSAVGISPAPSL